VRIAILGNSGSGKSTLARKLGAPVLDLDTVYWEPGKIAVPRDPADAAEMVRAFTAANSSWVVEGCYASLVSVALENGGELVFLNPGAGACVAHCLARPWEPHKYPSKAEQDKHLEFLLGWVRDYYSREGELSLRGHRTLFEAYTGPKIELRNEEAVRQYGNDR
jgi:adenylate kinase family enzyme